MTLPLFERFPGSDALPVAGIANLPTQLDDATSVLVEAEPALAGPGRISVKRDDLTSAVYGGNKVRKLDFLLGDAVREQVRCVLTFGAYGSNHALATAVHARAMGLEPHVVLSPQEPGPYAPRTLRAHARLGSVIHLVDGWDGRRAAVEARRELTERDGVAPYIIPMGGTCALGAIGYVNAALELAGQVQEPPDAVYVAGGTLGTAVGLAVGFAAAGWATRVESVRVTPGEIASPEIAAALTRETVDHLRSLAPAFPALEPGDLALSLREEFFEPGYGVVTPETLRAVEVARSAGYRIETTYTGKAFSAMIFDAGEGRLDGKSVVFWNTYNSAPYPEPGDISLLPARLQYYIAQCESEWPAARS